MPLEDGDSRDVHGFGGRTQPPNHDEHSYSHMPLSDSKECELSDPYKLAAQTSTSHGFPGTGHTFGARDLGGASRVAFPNVPV